MQFLFIQDESWWHASLGGKTKWKENTNIFNFFSNLVKEKVTVKERKNDFENKKIHFFPYFQHMFVI